MLLKCLYLLADVIWFPRISIIYNSRLLTQFYCRKHLIFEGAKIEYIIIITNFIQKLSSVRSATLYLRITQTFSINHPSSLNLEL
jgi:hypothetical protein